jgi:MFS superfamily sulfate permease-like transporter
MEKNSDWVKWLPGLLTLRRYQVSWLPRDIVAGIVLATMLVPVGIAYAIASGLPGIYGLYASILPLLAYALFGPSRILVLGPDSSLAAVILGVVIAHSGDDPGRAVVLAGAMAVVSGIVCIPCRRCPVWFRHGTFVQTDPLRIHEWNRADGADQPIA